jgi:hypothetical protein
MARTCMRKAKSNQARSQATHDRSLTGQLMQMGGATRGYRDVPFRNLPIRAVRLWKHLHCFLCTPLVRAERARETLAALLEWAARDARASAVDLFFIGGDGPFRRLLSEHAGETGSLARVTNSISRAMWKREEDIEAYLRHTLSGGILKEYRRQRRRLGELGQLDFITVRQADGVDDWMELIRLSKTLPEADVEYNAGDIPINVTPDRTPRNGLSAAETIRRIAQCKSWMVLKYVEHDPDYRALLHQCLTEVARHSEPI